MQLTPMVWIPVFDSERPEIVTQHWANLLGQYPEVAYYLDQHDWQWKQLPDGRWVRNQSYFVDTNGWDAPTRIDNWIEDDPNRTTAFDVSGYRWFKWYVDSKLPEAIGRIDYNDPWLFDEMLALGYNLFRGGSNMNPYFNTQVRDGMRDLAVRMELPAWYADRAAMDFAESHLVNLGQYYSEATPPSLVVDDVIRRLNALSPNWEAPTLTAAQRQTAIYNAENIQTNVKSHRETYEDAADASNGAQVISIFAAPIAFYAGAAVSAFSEAVAASAAASAEAAAAATMAVETSGAAAFSIAPEIAVLSEAAVGASAGWEGIGNFAYKFATQAYNAYKGGAFTSTATTARDVVKPTPLRIPIAPVGDVASVPEFRQAVSLIGLLLLAQGMSK